MKNTTIIVHNKAILTSEGIHTSACCKPVIAIELHKVFNSRLDAARYFGVSTQTIFDVLNGDRPHIRMYERDEHGNRIRFIGTCRLADGKNPEECMDMLMDHSRKMEMEFKQKFSMQETEMAEFRAWKAERDAARKAEEKRLAEIDNAKLAIIKAREKVERRDRMVARKESEWAAAVERRDEAVRELAEAEQKLFDLEGDE